MKNTAESLAPGTSNPPLSSGELQSSVKTLPHWLKECSDSELTDLLERMIAAALEKSAEAEDCMTLAQQAEKILKTRRDAE